jgi:hypothetical protein
MTRSSLRKTITCLFPERSYGPHLTHLRRRPLQRLPSIRPERQPRRNVSDEAEGAPGPREGATAMRRLRGDVSDLGRAGGADMSPAGLCSEPRTPAQVKSLLYHVGAFPPDQPRRGSPAQGRLPPAH